MSIKLTIELIPKSAHFQNARGILKRSQWDKVKLATAERAGHQCEICGPCDRVEAHEVWNWAVNADGTTGQQTLVRTIALCPWCHRVKHWGFTESTPFADGARKHALKVNGWSDDELDAHVREAWRNWVKLSKVSWTLDISYLEPWVNSGRRVSA